MYNTCTGRTIPYTPVKAVAVSPRARLAVWPADADIGLEVASDGVSATALPPIQPGEHVAQAFQRGARTYATISDDRERRLVWNSGSGWVAPPMIRYDQGFVLLGTTDLDHDGHLELIAYQLWANDYGVSIFVDTPQAFYELGCGNV
jgi:hypothetical protein